MSKLGADTELKSWARTLRVVINKEAHLIQMTPDTCHVSSEDSIAGIKVVAEEMGLVVTKEPTGKYQVTVPRQ